MNIIVRKIDKCDSEWINNLLNEHWGSEKVVSKGIVYHVPDLPGILAESNGENIGLLTYHLVEKEYCEIITLNSLKENQGIGGNLINTLIKYLKTKEIYKINLITTNDNINAIKFYQKRGFIIKTIYPGAIAKSRELKPQIPRFGFNGIPVRDEIEFELTL